jgi:histidine triad (HIT) family protein
VITATRLATRLTRVTDPDCLFCKIASGEIPADVVHETDHVVAFRDLQPQAPTHVLVIPKEHYADAAALATGSPDTVARLVAAAAAVADADGLDGHYRLVFNTGAGAGQSVFHTHLHVLGGRAMTWPPG